MRRHHRNKRRPLRLPKKLKVTVYHRLKSIDSNIKWAWPPWYNWIATSKIALDINEAMCKRRGAMPPRSKEIIKLYIYIKFDESNWSDKFHSIPKFPPSKQASRQGIGLGSKDYPMSLRSFVYSYMNQFLVHVSSYFIVS